MILRSVTRSVSAVKTATAVANTTPELAGGTGTTVRTDKTLPGIADGSGSNFLSF